MGIDQREFVVALDQVLQGGADEQQRQLVERGIMESDANLEHYCIQMDIDILLRASYMQDLGAHSDHDTSSELLSGVPAPEWWSRPWLKVAALLLLFLGGAAAVPWKNLTQSERNGEGVELSQRHREHGGGGKQISELSREEGAGSCECARQSRRFESGSKLPHSTPAPAGQLAELPVVHAPGHDPTDPSDHSDNPLAGGRGGARGGFTAEDAEVRRGGGVAEHPLLEPAVPAVAAPLHRDPSDPSNPSDPTDHSRDPPSFAALAAERTISATGTVPAALATEKPAALAPHKEEEADMTATQKLAAAASAVALTGATALHALPVVSNVGIEQIEHTRKVRITYDLAESDAIVTLAIETNGVAIPDEHVTWLSGDVNKKVEQGTSKEIEWNAGADWPENISDDTKARVTAWSLDNPPAVVVVDLSAGSGAAAYPVAWYPSTDVLLGGVTNPIYKSSHLVLKRIKCGGFPMGDNALPVTLTQDFYIGVYQITQQQWLKVKGGGLTVYFNDATDKPYRPMDRISYYDIRESTGNAADPLYNWPDQGHKVHPASFMGTLRSKTGDLLAFDLPTEAQWEYACRAGTETYYSDGISGTPNTTSNAQIDVLGRYAYNGGKICDEDTGKWGDAPQDSSADYGTAKVGSYLPNAWGLYDMHGNVNEWCLDWSATLTGGVDPVGPEDGNDRVLRGGKWDSDAANCRSAYRSSFKPLSRHKDYAGGFRVAATCRVSVDE